MPTTRPGVLHKCVILGVVAAAADTAGSSASKGCCRSHSRTKRRSLCTAHCTPYNDPQYCQIDVLCVFVLPLCRGCRCTGHDGGGCTQPNCECTPVTAPNSSTATSCAILHCNFEYLRILRCMRCLRVRLHIACCGSQLPHWSVARCCRGLDAATPKPYFITFLLLYVEAVAQTCGRGVTERGGDSSKTSRGCHSCPVSCSSAPVGPAAAVQQRATHFTVVTDPKSPHP